MPTQLLWDDLNQEVLSEFPELREPRFADLIGGFEGWTPGTYVVIGSAFNALIEDRVASAAGDRAKIGAFVERMAVSKSGGIEDLLRIDVLPTFLKSQPLLDAYWVFLGPSTRRFLKRTAIRRAPQIIFPSGVEDNRANETK